jgi:hypothetical protein
MQYAWPVERDGGRAAPRGKPVEKHFALMRRRCANRRSIAAAVSLVDTHATRFDDPERARQFMHGKHRK